MRGKVTAAVVVVVAVVAASAIVGAVAFRPGIRYPKAWDPRVTKIAQFVENFRGHRFKHPVAVYFLTPERYREVAGDGPDREPPSDGARRQSRAQAAEYRAVGLLEGDPDLLAAGRTLHDAGTLAFYSTSDDVVNVRGSKMTPALRVTLAHELTHALQDQYFSLESLDSRSADASGAARSIVEGDATSTEGAYIDSLTEAERADYEAETDRQSAHADTAIGGVPKVLQSLFGSYYAMGDAFVAFWQAVQNGEPDPKNLDSVLRKLPRRSAEVYEPLLYESGDRPPDLVPPEGPGSTSVFEQSEFGTDFLFLTLSERIDPAVALRATDGLRGDSYQASFVKGDRICIVDLAQLATNEDANEFHAAIETWIAKMPPEADAKVEPIGNTGTTVSFSTCDPGKDAKMSLPDEPGDALLRPVARLQVAGDAIAAGRSRKSAFCYGTAVVEALSSADLRSDVRTPAIDRAVEAAVAKCP